MSDQFNQDDPVLLEPIQAAQTLHHPPESTEPAVLGAARESAPHSIVPTVGEANGPTGEMLEYDPDDTSHRMWAFMLGITSIIFGFIALIGSFISVIGGAALWVAIPGLVTGALGLFHSRHLPSAVTVPMLGTFLAVIATVNSMNASRSPGVLSGLGGDLDSANERVEQIIGGNGNGEKQGGPLNGLPSTQESLDNIREYKKALDGLLDGSFMNEK
ncbi:MAG TPA: hypothetical protein DIT88_15330 [Planctomycetaceae bacterium]|nr:hypothetical protein [Planctomycetaceae bacterium]